MKRLNIKFLLCCSFIIIGFIASSQNRLQDAISKELDREFQLLSTKTPAVYYLSYKVDDISGTVVQANLGSITVVNQEPARLLSIDLRVGDYELDNSAADMNRYQQSIPLPIDNEALAIQHTLWLSTDLMYKFASATYNKAKSVKTDSLPSFSQTEPTVFSNLVEEENQSVNISDWQNRLSVLSEKFLKVEGIVDASVRLDASKTDSYFISSEGSSIAQTKYLNEIQISASVRSIGGEVINLNKNYFAPSVSELPSETTLSTDVEDMIIKLEQLRKAPKAEPFSGPAIFSGSSASVFFHEIFGHRIEAHRLGDDQDSQTFKDKMGERVLPKFLTIEFDPTLSQYQDFYLTGSYAYDDEGVKAQKVNVVESGILTSFLHSRKPLTKTSESNGHARAQAGFSPVSRQSNLLVKSDKVKSDALLRKELLKECKKQKKEYGYFIKQVAGGYTMTDRYRPNAFSIAPTEVYKVFVDQRPDELVRGVDLIGTPLTMFSQIMATGDQLDAFYGYCGAESGYVPVTAISPSILVKKIETQKSIESNIDQPILADPNQIKD